jgi:hypothetical protein
MRDDSAFNLSAHAMIAFSREEKKLAVGLASIPFDANFGIYCENFLSSYYPTILGIFVPFYSIAYGNLLSRMLATPSQGLVSGILGPNRLSTYYLDKATLTAFWELNSIYDVLEALRFSPRRPVVVGHGANGLLAKALPFLNDPWRVSFEGPVLEDSPIATLAQDKTNRTRRPTIVNYYTNGSIYAVVDRAAFVNTQIIRSPLSAVIPPGPFETFCVVAAACAEDTRFDALCDDVLGGSDGFLKIWMSFDRERASRDITNS